MAQITINEISKNYVYSAGDAAFATVAFPISACWGPAYDPNEEVVPWLRFQSTAGGVNSFIATYRGAASNFKTNKDFSYNTALTLLAAGYDVLVCRMTTGAKAEAPLSIKVTGETLTLSNGSATLAHHPVVEKTVTLHITKDGEAAKDYSDKTGSFAEEITFNYTTGVVTIASDFGTVTAISADYSYLDPSDYYIKARYAGTFGNGLSAVVHQTNVGTQATPVYHYNMIVSYTDQTGRTTTLENIFFVDDEANVTDDIPYYEDIESKFVDIVLFTKAQAAWTADKSFVLAGGTDYDTTVTVAGTLSTNILKAITDRGYETTGAYYTTVYSQLSLITDVSVLQNAYDHEKRCTFAYQAFDELTDKLNYNFNRLCCFWDDQTMTVYLGRNYVADNSRQFEVSALHKKLTEIAFFSRCGAALIDTPKDLPRKFVKQVDGFSYADELSGYTSANASGTNVPLYNTNSALCTPWGEYVYSGMTKMNEACPSFIVLLIQRAALMNQSIQYEWALPMNRRTNLNIGKLKYTISKKLLDQWQSTDGVGVNAIVEIPELGTLVWGDSTLYDLPPATWNALANLSTRYLVNAVENLVYKCGINITFQYNNEQSFNKFYAGCVPLLDTMKNVGAITGYRIEMSADINGLDSVNANSVIGKIYLTVVGVIKDITVDLTALPASVDLANLA